MYIGKMYIGKVLDELGLLQNRKKAEKTRFYKFLVDSGYAFSDNDKTGSGLYSPTEKAMNAGYTVEEKLPEQEDTVFWDIDYLSKKMGISRDSNDERYFTASQIRRDIKSVRNNSGYDLYGRKCIQTRIAKKAHNEVTEIIKGYIDNFQSTLYNYTDKDGNPTQEAIDKDICIVQFPRLAWDEGGVAKLVTEFHAIDEVLSKIET